MTASLAKPVPSLPSDDEIANAKAIYAAMEYDVTVESSPSTFGTMADIWPA